MCIHIYIYIHSVVDVIIINDNNIITWLRGALLRAAIVSTTLYDIILYGLILCISVV